MKNIAKLVITLVGIATISCSKNDVQDRPIIQGIDEPVLISPDNGSPYELLPTAATQQVDRIVWKSANYGGSVLVNYVVEIDKESGDFKTPQVLGTTTNGITQLQVTTQSLNAVCIALGTKPFTSANFLVRIVSSAAGFDKMYSKIVTIAVKPYTTEAPKLYLIGDFLNASGYGANWTPAATLPYLAASAYGKTDFEGYVNINDANAQFKFLPTNVNFDGDYGNATGPDGSNTGVLLQTGESNAGLPTPKMAGYYLVTADTDPTKLTYKMTKKTWKIIGEATPNGWDNDTDLTYDATTKKWTGIIKLIGGKPFKFRANADWNTPINNFGVDTDGKLQYNGSNIIAPTATGMYKVELDLSKARAYTYTLTAQ
jgi:starch-binding outer membrane protein SusE/F